MQYNPITTWDQLPNSVQILSVPDKGRGLYATRDFQEKELIFSERPLACQLKSTPTTTGHRNCGNCLRFLGPFLDLFELLCSDLKRDLPPPEALEALSTSVPKLQVPTLCPDCTTKFCQDCFPVAQELYHSILCTREKSSDSSKSLLEFLRLSEKNPWLRLEVGAKLLAIIATRVRKAKLPLNSAIDIVVGRFASASARRVFASIPEIEKLIVSSLEYLKPAFSVTNLEELGNILSIEFWDSVLGTIAINNRQIIIHSPMHRYFENGLKNLDSSPYFLPLKISVNRRFGSLPPAIGTGFFSGYSIMNHSCNANTVTGLDLYSEIYNLEEHFARSYVYAKRLIKKGEEITSCYIDVKNKSVQERRVELKMRYLFDCNCDACVNGFVVM